MFVVDLLVIRGFVGRSVYSGGASVCSVYSSHTLVAVPPYPTLLLTLWHSETGREEEGYGRVQSCLPRRDQGRTKKYCIKPQVVIKVKLLP